MASSPIIIQVATPGPAGPQGPIGPTGTPGYTPKFYVAAGAPASGTGLTGDMYINSVNSDVWGPKINDTTWPATPAMNIEGATGATGYSPQYIVAPGAPAGGVGANGDMYINSTTSDVWGPKSGGLWPATPACNIKGATGAQGPAGIGVTDPTTTKGDFIIRQSPTVLTRLGVGSDGMVLTADAAQTVGVKWAAPVSGGFSDPTTTKGDLIVRGAAAPATRLPVGSNGQILIADSAQALGVKWGADISQTPWTSNIDGAGFALNNAGKIAVGLASPVGILHAKGPAAAPSITATNQIVTISVGSGGNGQHLQIGGQNASPWGTWLQGSYDGNPGFASPILMQLAGGNVGINTTAPGLNSASTPQTCVVQIKGALVLGGTTQAPNEDGLIQLGAFNFVSANNWNGMGLIGQNLAIKSVGSADTYYTPVGHPSVGYAAMQTHGSGFKFFGGTGATTAGGAITPIVRMIIDSGGSVGIGTATPTGTLTIHSATDRNLRILAGGSTMVVESFNDANTTDSPLAFIASTVTMQNNTGAFNLNVVGVVGIGMAAPLDRLHMAAVSYSANQNGGLRISSPGNEWNARFALKSDGSGNPRGAIDFYDVEILAFTGTGIGIKKSAPGYAIDAAGDCNISGTYRVNGTPISGGSGITTQSVVTGSRALGTVYQNTTGKPMLVTASISVNNGAVSGTTDSASSPTTVVVNAGNPGATPTYLALSFWVLPGNYYKVVMSSGSGAVGYWTEWS